MNVQNLIEFFPASTTVHKAFCNAFDVADDVLDTFGTYYVESLTFKDGCPAIRAYTIYKTWCDVENVDVYLIFGWTISKNRIEIDEEPITSHRFYGIGFALSYLMNDRQVYEIKK